MLNSCDAFGQLATNTIHWPRLDAILLPCYTLLVYANFVNYLRHWLPGRGKAGKAEGGGAVVQQLLLMLEKLLLSLHNRNLFVTKVKQIKFFN